jgi:hypothetical protein
VRKYEMRWLAYILGVVLGLDGLGLLAVVAHYLCSSRAGRKRQRAAEEALDAELHVFGIRR